MYGMCLFLTRLGLKDRIRSAFTASDLPRHMARAVPLSPAWAKTRPCLLFGMVYQGRYHAFSDVISTPNQTIDQKGKTVPWPHLEMIFDIPPFLVLKIDGHMDARVVSTPIVDHLPAVPAWRAISPALCYWFLHDAVTGVNRVLSIASVAIAPVFAKSLGLNLRWSRPGQWSYGWVGTLTEQCCSWANYTCIVYDILHITSRYGFLSMVYLNISKQ